MAQRSRPMVRAERRKQILGIARELVAAEGIAALTMTALSERANVAKPVVYSHFSNRQQVAVALLDEHFDQLTGFVAERLEGAATLEDYISRLVDASFEFEGSSDTPVQKITNGFSADDEVNRAFLRYEEDFHAHWQRLLELCGVPPEALELGAHALWGMVNSTVYNYAPKAKRRNQAAEMLKTLLLSAIRALMPDQQLPTGAFEISLEAVAGAMGVEPFQRPTSARAKAKPRAARGSRRASVGT